MHSLASEFGGIALTSLLKHPSCFPVGVRMTGTPVIKPFNPDFQPGNRNQFFSFLKF